MRHLDARYGLRRLKCARATGIRSAIRFICLAILGNDCQAIPGQPDPACGLRPACF